MHAWPGVVLAAVLTAVFAASVAGCTAPVPRSGSATPMPAATDRAAPPTSTPPLTATALPAGSSTQEVLVEGVVRTFRVYRPARTGDPAPLVLVFHGYGGSAAASESSYGWNTVAEREGFVVAYLQGVDSSFNAGACCGAAAQQGVNDVSAALTVVDRIAASTALDADRMYVTGFSNGAAMTYRMACETDRFAAFGPVSGGQVVDCAGRAPTSIQHVHGAADTTVPIGGDPNGMGHPPIRETLAGWRDHQQCEPAMQTSTDGVHRSSSSCPGGREVDLIVVDGLTHTWPTTIGETSGAETLWRFFARHQR